MVVLRLLTKSSDTVAMVLLLACFLMNNHHIDAFSTTIQQRQSQPHRRSVKNVPPPPWSPSSLSMAKFDRSTNLFVPEGPSEEPSAGYGLVGSLIRAGPLPFFRRVADPVQYEQAVLKYMATDGCDRNEAQGNMDAFFENPNDWQYQKLQEKKGGAKKDYANANTSPKEVALTGTWALIVVVFFTNFIIDCINGKYVRPS